MHKIANLDTSLTYKEVTEAKQQDVWEKLGKVRLYQAMQVWLSGLSKCTASSYKSGMNMLEHHGVLDMQLTLQQFSQINHSMILYKIGRLDYSEATKQARAGCYISFTKFLYKLSEGIIHPSIPEKTGVDQTFFKIRQKVKTVAITPHQWRAFFNRLRETGHERERLICCLMLQGGKRISEVLDLNLKDVNWESNQIKFRQSKTRKLEQYTIITFPQHIMDDLKRYTEPRIQGILFRSKFGTRISYVWVRKMVIRAAADLGLNICTHTFRASCVTYLKALEYSDADIQKITGHSSSESLHQYDKNDLSNNPTKRLDIINGTYDERDYSHSSRPQERRQY